MFNPMDHDFIFLAVSLLAFWFSGWIGVWWRARHGSISEELRDYFSLILGAALTLLGLIIAFTFSMAVNRYDQRKNYEEQEANAIGTEYVRASQLPPADAAKVHALLRSYLDQRILNYKARNERGLLQINARAGRARAAAAAFLQVHPLPSDAPAA
jgi:hypothetical protein